MSAWPGKLMQSCRCCWVSHCLLMILSHRRSSAANNNSSQISAGNDTFFISHWCAADETLMEMIKLMIFFLHWEDLCTHGPRCWCGHLTDTDQPIAPFPVNISETDLQVHPLQALFPHSETITHGPAHFLYCKLKMTWLPCYERWWLLFNAVMYVFCM